MKTLKTRKGEIQLPTFMPVTTFGGKYPLDNLVRPYLARLASAGMVSMYYAKQRTKESIPLPTFIDSGGFASLFENAKVVEEDGLGILEILTEDGVDRSTVEDVLRFQEEHAEIAATLDFPIPPSMDLEEAELRQRLTIANARWAIKNRGREDLLLFACIQAWDVESARRCVDALVDLPFDGFAIGGLVPRARNLELVEGIVRTVRAAIGERPLHVFGLGKPETLTWLMELGVDSTDSSSYVKMAADGKTWTGEVLADPSPTERMKLAIDNLRCAQTAIQTTSHVPRKSRS
jgi:helicase